MASDIVVEKEGFWLDIPVGEVNTVDEYPSVNGSRNF